MRDEKRSERVNCVCVFDRSVRSSFDVAGCTHLPISRDDLRRLSFVMVSMLRGRLRGAHA